MATETCRGGQAEAVDGPTVGSAVPVDGSVSWTGGGGGRSADRWERSSHGEAERRPQPAGHRSEKEWCPGRDLNPDELPHTPLKRTRIPIPPPGHQVRCRRLCSGSRGIEVLVPRTGLEPIRPCGH